MSKHTSKADNLFLTVPQFERLREIHCQIAEMRYPNTRELASYFGVSEITITRDIANLRDFYGAPIAHDASKRGYYYSEDYDFPLLKTITDKQIQTLQNAKIMMESFEGTPLYKDAQELLESISKGAFRSKQSLLDRIAVSPRPEVHIDKVLWDKIIRALENNLVLKFEYKGQYQEKTLLRMVHPYQILLDGKNCFLWGYSEERNACRIFNLTRMKCVVVTTRTFELPPDYSFEKHLDGGRFGAFVQGESEEYKIEFYAYGRPFVKSCIWADDQRLEDDDDRNVTTITFHSNQMNAILEWVLSQGAYSKPLAPPKLVDDWKSHVKLMMKNIEV